MTDQERLNLSPERIHKAANDLRERGLIEVIDSDDEGATVKMTPALEEYFLQGIVAGQTLEETIAQISAEHFGDDDDS